MTTTTIETRRTSPPPRRKPRFRGELNPDYYRDPRNASISNFLRVGPNMAMLTRAQYENQEVLGQARALGPGVYAGMRQVLDGAPTVTPGIAVALAMMGAHVGVGDTILTDDIRDRILALDATSTGMDTGTPDIDRRPKPGSAAERSTGLMRLIKAISRPAFAALSAPQEAVIGGIRGAVGALTAEGPTDWEQVGWQLGGILPPIALLGEVNDEFKAPNPWEQTMGGQMILDVLDTNQAAREKLNITKEATRGVSMGDGFFVGGDVLHEQVQAARAAAPLVGGHAWTLGRGFASLVYQDTDSLAYETLSGIVDLAAVLLLDPTVIGAKASAVAKGARAGARVGAIARQSDAATGAVLAREAARLVDDVGEHTRSAITLTQDTARAVRDVTAVHQKAAAQAQKLAAGTADPLERIDLLARRDDLLDATDLARADLAKAKAGIQAAGGVITPTGKPQVGAARLPDAEAKVAIDELSMAIGDDALDSMMARVTGLAPNLPGHFTDAVFTATKRKATRPNLLPGSVDGRDGLLGWTGTKPPNLVSVDDEVEGVDDILAAFKSTLGGRSNARKTAVRDLTDFLTTPGLSWGELIEHTADLGLGRQLYRVLLDSDIDGVTDIFRLRGGENGVWWTSRNIDPYPWGRAGWERGVDLRADAMSRLTDARHELAAVDKALKLNARKGASYRRMADLAVDEIVRGVDNLTTLGDEEAVLRNALELGFGVDRQLGKAPGVNYEALQAALFGDTNRLDDLLEIHLGARGRAGEAFGRATLATATLGVSEIVRPLAKTWQGKVIRPARERVLQALVDAGEKDVGLIHQLTKGKLEPETLAALARAESTEEVIEVLAPRLGLMAGTPLTGNPLGAGRMITHSVTGHTPNVVWTRALDWLNKATAIQPRAFTHLNYSDPKGSANVLRSYLMATGMPVTKVNDVLTPYLLAETEPGRARAAMDGFNQLAAHLSETHNKRFSGETREVLDEALRKATRLYEGGVAEINNWWRPRYARDANLGYLTTQGKRVELFGPQLEAELARGGTALPDPMAIRAAYGRWGRVLTEHSSIANVREYAEKGMDIWRTAVLARLAYIWRNIGEMQIRMQLFGHQTVFSHPFNHIAMAWSMNPRSGPFRRTVGNFARYNRTVHGTKMMVPRGGDIDDYEAGIDEFAGVMTRDGSFHDMRTYRNAAQVGGAVRPVRVDQPEFNRAWADQLMMLHASRLSRIVAGENPVQVAAAVERGMRRDDAVIWWLSSTQEGAKARRALEEGGPAYRELLSDPKALRQYLFDGPASIAARIDEMTAKVPELVDFVRTGRLVHPRTGNVDFRYRTTGDPGTRQSLMATRTARLGKALTAGKYKQALPADYRITARVPSGNKGDYPRRIGSVFFNWAGSLERAHAVGPEFAYTYWDTVADLMPALDSAGRVKVMAEAARQTGLMNRRNINLIKIRRGNATPAGPLTLDDVHAVASRTASEQVERLFYDAARRQQFWHATRLALPFGQATYNTFSTWGRLMATKPVAAYKVGRALNAAQEPGSNVVYDWFNQLDPFGGTYDHDPNQGFLYREPDSNELMFKFPIAGSALGAVLAPLIGYNLPEAQTLTATASSLNLALQGKVDFLPGAGPLISLPASVVMPDDWYGSVPDFLRDWMFPFGEPQTEAGVIESQMPAWFRRFVLGTFFNEEFRAYAYKGAMAYVASSRDWPGLNSDPMVQAEFREEVERVAKAMTAIRGIGTFVLPSAPLQDIYAYDKSGELVSMTLLGSYWRQVQDAYPNDFERQLSGFFELFGEDAIYGIVPTTKGERTITTPGWNFQRAHSAEARAHSKVLGVFFPGDFSAEAATWLRQTDKRRRLSVQEREEEAMRYLYKARVAAIEGNAATYEWDSDTLAEAKRVLVEEEFGGVAPPYVGSDAATLEDVRRALRTAPNLARTRGGEGAFLLFDAYDSYTAQSEQLYGSGLSSKKATRLRERFLAEVNQITSQYALIPGREDEGSVDLIADMFIRAVEPRS